MRRRGMGLALAGPLLMLVLGAASACDGGEAEAGADGGGTASAGADANAQNKAYAQCVRENGVPNFPDPGPDPENPWPSDALQGLGDQDALAGAMQACQDKAPAGIGRASETMGDAADKWRPVAQCMRENGLDVPDPDPNQTFLSWAETFRSQPGFERVGQECVAKAGIDLGAGAGR